MKQLTLATVGFERYAKTTRRTAFLDEMDSVVPWSALCAVIEPFYPKPGNGRPPVGVERMLRILAGALTAKANFFIRLNNDLGKYGKERTTFCPCRVRLPPPTLALGLSGGSISA
jgi:hypothetical protein